ncbi:Alpha/Beta hydrolase protein [Aspergillus multicolor]|uniref:CocE/NonD family hydrolase n=1 Tax=Aspergillus multicolor TaxID=41759 RepID=UPI003CCCF127
MHLDEANYTPFNQTATVLKKGSKPVSDLYPALPCDILFESDVPVTLRDGTVIYTDIYRPVNATKKIPAIVAYSPYGKRGGYFNYDNFQPPDAIERMAVPYEWVSGLEKFEGPNPAYWVNQGYAVVHPDPRGVFHSGGDILMFGQQDARDGYDLIEWLAERDWSNGKVGMTGNSWLTVAQWWIASERPPHLAAIAPWEGWTDFYEDLVFRGGIPNLPFVDLLVTHLYGNGSNLIENIAEMAAREGVVNDYWLDKAARIEEIDATLLVYAVGSWTNTLHTLGTFQGWERLRTPNKWLRTHTTHEWHDYYTPAHVADLHRFFEHYLNDVPNDWEATPRVRLSLLNPGHDDILDQPEAEFPLARAQSTRYYLDADTLSMAATPPSTPATATYNSTIQATANGTVSFTMPFPNATDLVGYATARLWVQAADFNDMDLFCYLQKSKPANTTTETEVIPIEVLGTDTYVGAHGRVRVSLRDARKPRTNGIYPYAHDTPQFLNGDEIVPVDIPFWPTAIHYEPGEQLTLLVQGWNTQKQPEFQGLGQPDIINQGRHVIHTGGRYASYVEIPQVAPR